MFIDVSTEDKKQEILNLFKTFNTKKEIYKYYNVCCNTNNLHYINDIAKAVGFDFSYYKEKKKRYCLQCGKELKYGQKEFCCSSCAAKYNNKGKKLSEETKQKIAQTLQKKYSTEEKKILLKSDNYTTYKLKDSLFRKGLKEYKCEICGLSEWMGKEIVLHLHHKDGNKFNNNIENLQILCPNCHSQTDNYCDKNRKGKKVEHFCKNCGKILKHKNINGLCLECYNKEIEKNSTKPSKEMLEKDFQELKSYASLSRKYNVSVKVIKKWLIKFGIIQ